MASLFRPLSRWERWGLFLLAGLFVLHSLNVGHRSLFLTRRMTDLDVYLRAAWAARTGGNLYEITDDSGFHYIYPPLLAIVLTPFADPPAGADVVCRVPFAVSVFLMYALSVLCAFWASHWVARGLERSSLDPAIRSTPPGCWRWWMLRIIPLVVVLPGILGTLVHGQVNLLLLALLCGMIGAVLRQRSWLAGFFLSGAICLKVFPVFLVLHALWRRDYRCLAGCALGLALGLVVVPAAFWGPQEALEQYRQFAVKVLCPGLGVGADRTLARTLTNVTATDSQSFVAMFHNSLHLDRAARPDEASASTRAAALLAGGLLTVLTLWSAGWRRRRSARAEVLFFGQLVVAMLLLCPVCHLSYFCMVMPLVMVVVESASLLARGPTRLLTVLLVGELVATTLPYIPGLEVLRDVGLAAYGALVWWTVALVMLYRETRIRPFAQELSAPASMAA